MNDRTSPEQEHNLSPSRSNSVLHDRSSILDHSDTSTTQTTQFEYPPLEDSDSFRLLIIHHSPNPLAPLTLTLSALHFSNPPPAYEALSYVWGSEPGSTTVSCNGKTLSGIGTSLHEALMRLRRREVDRVVWVDALCIRQDDEREKGMQVRKMHWIYARARRVVVWLGRDGNRDAEGAFGLMCALVSDASWSCGLDDETCRSTAVVFEALEDGETTIKSGYRSVPPVTNVALWRSMFAFFDNPWFVRMWVLQEIVLAQSARVIWGTCEIDWSIIGIAIDIIRADQTLHSLLESRMLQNAFFMQYLRQLHRSASDRLEDDGEKEADGHPFLHLLDIARSFDVTEPRDKVYGLVGFFTGHSGLDACGFIIPDYTKKVEEVYAEVAWRVMQADGNLNILSFVVNEGYEKRGTRPLEMPSWVPDWTCKDVVYPLIGFELDNQHRAGTFRQLEVTRSRDDKALCVKGVVVDVVRSVGGRIPFTNINDSDAVLRELVDWCLLEYAEESTLADTLTAGRNAAGHLVEDPDQHRADFFTLLSDLSIDSVPISQEGKGGDAARAKEAVRRYSCFRKAFKTEKGTLVLGPGSVRVGDKVVVLWGGQVPFVLREMIGKGEKEIWQFEGEAYVPGIMNGEVEDLVREATSVERVFEIR